MRKLLLLLLALACGIPALPAQSAPDYAALFRTQLQASCSGQLTWEKSVQELDGGTTETHIYRIDCAAGSVTDPATQAHVTLPTNEFGYLFELLATHPRIAPLYTVVQEGGSLHAVIKAEHYDESQLKKQDFEVDANGKLRYVSSTLRKSNTLYDLDISIAVWFDATGRYERHETTTASDVLLGGSVKTLIKGRILP
jgi:hypothetical protein